MSHDHEPPKDAARRLASGAIRKGFQPQALHVYTNRDGMPLYWRIRLKDPQTGEKWIRPMKLTDEGYTLGEPDYPDGKPLYRLPELTARPNDLVMVTEGELCADSLANAGVLATTSGAADSAIKADWSIMAGRTVTIWPDNDEAGSRYAEAVAAILSGLGCIVCLIDVNALALPPKGDVVDWFAATPGATAADIATLPTITYQESTITNEIQACNIGAPSEPQNLTSNNSESLFDTVTRLARLTPLEYEQIRETEAQRLGVRVGVLDKEVKASKREQQVENGKAVMFPTVEPWHEPVAGDALLYEILTTLQRFIVCERETAITATLWCAFTWLVDSVQVAPLAVITAPEKRCGKSQLLNLIGRLSRRPLVASNISSPAMFRVIEAHGPTLLIDEADTFFRENEELRGVINSGHTRQSAYVIRTVGDAHEPCQFSTWGAKAISGIGHLAETIMDRAVILELRRKLPHESIQRLRHAEPGLFNRLASKLARYAEDSAPAIERARPNLPEALNDRAQDNWEPLLAIADHAGGDWPELARRAALKLSGAEQDTVSLSAELLADIREVFDHKRVERLSTVDMLQALTDDELKPWATYNRGKPMSPRQLAKRLGEYGIQSRDIRFGYDGIRKGYELAQFTDAFTRYLTPSGHPPPLSATTLQPINDGASGVADHPQRCGNDNLSATHEVAQHKDCSGVADKTPIYRGDVVEVEI